MGVRGSFHLISVDYFNCLIEGQEPEAEEDDSYSIDKSWYGLHEVFKHQQPPLDKTISGDGIPKEFAGNTIELFGTSSDYYDFYCGLVSISLTSK